jgi:hypothetical protein
MNPETKREAIVSGDIPNVGDIKTAWELVGWDNGLVKIVGGRTTYEAVMYNDPTGGRLVKLAKLVGEERGVREVKRYVEPETKLVIVSKD